MSASLVGSEMCIRDRETFADSDAVASYLLPRALDSPAHLRMIYNGLTVSYTHLTLPTICSV
eukprot:4782524-Alexandrium_andersonii.AAC.1